MAEGIFQTVGGVLLSCLLMGSAQAADVAQIRDGIDAAVISGDSAALSGYAEELDGASGDWVPYYQAYLNYRLSQVADTPKKIAKKQLNTCIDILEELLEQRPDRVEAYALLATCYGNSAAYYMLRAASRGSSSNKALKEALRLGSDNPRVLLQDAQSLIFRPAIFGGDKEKALQQLQLAAEQFVNWRSDDATAPVWGEAETWYFIGVLQREAGETEAAQAALDKALEIAPGYTAAMAELASLAELG
jgi:tetratricopeptide (TPR) repeat protein